MLRGVALLSDRQLGGVRRGIDGETTDGHGLGLVDEELDRDGARARPQATRDDVTAAHLEFRSGCLRIVHVETTERQPVAGAPPERVIVIQAAPDALVFAAVAQVAEEGVHILEPALGLHVRLEHGDPGAAIALDQAIEGLLVVTK